MDDIKLGMLGNRDAAKRLTEAGVLIACPFCGGEVNIVVYDPRLYRPSRNHTYAIACYECDIMFGWDIDYGGRFDTEDEARLAWNTRAPILGEREMEMLNENRPD